MEKYYDLVMAYTINEYAKKEIQEELLGIASKGATEEERWRVAKAAFSGSKLGVITEWGLIDFDPDELLLLANGENLSYDEYLEIMKLSANQVRTDFEKCYYDAWTCHFKGKIKKINKKRSTICFERIYVDGWYSDGEGFVGKEDHVWMNLQGFEEYKIGDCLSFTAEVYRYVKCGNGKRIDFGLRNPEDIAMVDSYELPTDEELQLQAIDQIICEVCLFREHCYGFCIANQEWREGMRQQLLGFKK